MHALRLLALGTALLIARQTLADIHLPGGKTIPDPSVYCNSSNQAAGLQAVFACSCTQAGICNIGQQCPTPPAACDTGQNGTCETTIWHVVNDGCAPSQISGLHPVHDAAVMPETFRPVCGLKFLTLSRGQALFRNAFGWYNVAPGGAKPDDKDLHVIIDCTTPNGTVVPFDLLSQPDYKGGEIGFFIVTPESRAQSEKGTCANKDCCASVARLALGEGYVYYSQPQFNPDSGANAFIHLLIYSSKVFPYRYYFAWEDVLNGTSMTDYADFVTAVDGISCSGSGVQCQTGKPGLCGLGVTMCDTDGALFCQASNEASPEVCDGLDNNCDGETDNGATCPDGKKCYRGVCVGSCRSGQEFACQLGYECDATADLCVETQCKGKTCKPGEVCRAGVCGNGCEGAICPDGQVCQAGLCVDFCAGRVCKSSEICTLGVCVPDCLSCGGPTCTGGLQCDKSTGRCVDPSCTPACVSGTVCKKGKCVGPCDGVVCPGGTTCANGICPPPGIAKPGPVVDQGVPWTPDGKPAEADQGQNLGVDFQSGCSCELGAAWRVRGALLGCLALLAVLGAGLSRRSRRSR